MPDAAVEGLATNPAAKVIVFVDGQNLYKTCKSLFGHPLCHPHLLAQHLAGERRHVGCRFYTGRPNPNNDPTGARNLDRRLSIMRREGVTVITRPLRYHWDWGHQGRKLPRPGPNVLPQEVLLTPWMRPQEKGIDLVIGLDVVELLVTRVCDVAIIVSLDRDLYEIPQAIQNLGRLIAQPVRLEAAVPVPDSQRQPKILPGFSYTHQINRQVFQGIQDNIDYTAPDSVWTPPQVPRTIS
ncbi:MAG TPA: NYN domain-containing protein [Streptosporangiaceae bacterium]|jgi:uncharacterized LabA/DUF88 family protein